MAGIHADEARNAAGTGPMPLYKQWASKAWANANGSGTVAIRNSRNVSAMTDYGIGDYGFSLTSNMSGSYMGMSSCLQTGGFYVAPVGSNHSKTASAIRLGYFSSATSGNPPNFTTATDFNEVDMVIQGDLA